MKNKSNNEVLQQSNDTAVNKQSFSWHYISTYLEMLHGFYEAMSDPVFNQLLSNLANYVEKVISLPDCITAIYVAVEYKK